jgi:hypothetical protein
VIRAASHKSQSSRRSRESVSCAIGRAWYNCSLL